MLTDTLTKLELMDSFTDKQEAELKEIGETLIAMNDLLDDVYTDLRLLRERVKDRPFKAYELLDKYLYNSEAVKAFIDIQSANDDWEKRINIDFANGSKIRLKGEL